MGFIRRLFNSEPSKTDEQTQEHDHQDQQPDSPGDAALDEVTSPSATAPEAVDSAKSYETQEVDALRDAAGDDTTPDETLEDDETGDYPDPINAGEFDTEGIASANPTDIPSNNTRPLDPVPTAPNPTGHIMFGQASDVGMMRENNQDAVLSFFATSKTVDEQPDFGVFVVADGMGGHIHGERASAIATRVVAQQMMDNIYSPLLRGENLNDAGRPTIAEALISAVKNANEEILASMRGSDEQTGTTVTALVILDSWAHLAHVGDSRAYLVSHDEKGGTIEQITRDHSLVQRLIELGQLQPEEADEHPKRNVLYRAVGQQEDLEVDTLSRRLRPGNSILICSDGLWGLVGEGDIQKTILNTPDPQEACEKLIALANSHGGNDNITAVVLKIPGS